MPKDSPSQLAISILIVDDSETDRAIFRRFLTQNKSANYTFYEAESVSEGLSIIELGKPDCILLDYDLPDGTGTELIQQITARYGRQAIPLVMLSGSENIEIAVETIRSGAQDFLVKNRASAADLVRAVNNAIEKVRLFQEKMLAVKAIRDSEEKYRLLFDHTPLPAIVFDLQTLQILAVNDYAVRHYGYTNEKLLTMKFSQLHASGQADQMLAAQFGDQDCRTASVFAKHRQQSGRLIDVEINCHDITFKDSPARFVIVQDVTERNESERRLRESEQQFSMLAESMPQLAWMADAEGDIFWYNRNWYDYTGTTLADMEGWGWQAVHDPAMLPEVTARWQESLSKGTIFEMEFPLRRGDGQFRWFLTRVNPFRDSEGHVIRWLGTNTDIEDLRQMRLLAEQANNLKDEFLAMLSHELRTPLNAILGWSQILQNRQLKETEMKKALAIIDRSAHSQSQLIDDILDISRIVTGKFRLDVRAIDLVKVISAAIETVRPAAEAKSIRLQLLLDPEASIISGDPDRLQQVIWNLLSNAVKFTPKGGRIQVRLERVNSHVEIVISDTGKGIEPEFLPFVFDRFRQSDGSMTRRHGGLGLGLAIVRQIVELHGGSVSVSSKGEGKGATFRIDLPLLPLRVEPESNILREHPEAVSFETVASAKEEEENEAIGVLSNLRILIVDDETDSRELLKLALETRGAVVTVASSAAEAYENARHEVFNIIISDIGMPGEDGFSLIKKVRLLPREQGGKTPAIALTAYARAEDRIKALQSGFQMHIAKPIHLQELVAAVLNLAN